MTARKVWTVEEIRAFGVRMDGVTACSVIYGCGRTKSYTLLRTGQVDFKVIKVPGTNRYVVPTESVLRLLVDDAG